MSSPRSYHSPLRTERAQQTRTMILRAARSLFEAQGFPATTIKDIAQEAAVSEPTVYATFGSKANLVSGLLEQLEQDAADEAPGARMPVEAEEALTAWLDAHARIFERGRALLRVIVQALSEPEVAELSAEGDRHRRKAIEQVISSLADANRLKLGLDVTTAVDQAWALSSVAVYLALTDDCDWTTAQYRHWLESSLRQLLLRS